MTEIGQARLVYVAPTCGRSGVGDYADDFLAAVTPHFADVLDYRITSEGSESVTDVLRDVRAIRSVVADAASRGPVILHLEMSAGSLATFWGAIVPSDILVSATVHDAPQPVWWPFKTTLAARHRLWHHGIHYPFRPLTNLLQRKVVAGATLVALTSIGADNIRPRYPQSEVRASRIYIPQRPALRRLTERPSAVGLFGHNYKGKGFELTARLRELLNPDIGIVVAGRGTESLSAVEGVSILGEVNGTDEDKFFESIRFLAVPYSKDNVYGKVWAASSAVTRSFAYRTPIVSILDGSLIETVREGGAIGVDGGIDGVAAAINQAVNDTETLNRLDSEIAALQTERTIERCIIPFLDAWHDMLNRAGHDEQTTTPRR